MKKTVVERLMLKSVWVGECLEWQGALADGYGSMMVNRKQQGVHRLAWVQVHGPIPEGMLIDHTCHNRKCINVNHLRLATRKQNNENKKGASRQSKSGVRGVCWDKRPSKWKAYARHNGKLYHAGYFESLKDAEEAAKELRKKLFTFSML
jgi:hypothetical protein